MENHINSPLNSIYGLRQSYFGGPFRHCPEGLWTKGAGKPEGFYSLGFNQAVKSFSFHSLSSRSGRNLLTGKLRRGWMAVNREL